MHRPNEFFATAITSPKSRPRILVVDDDSLIAGLHAAILELEGYDVMTSDNGEDALLQLAADHFDLVLTDRSMPVLDGASMVLALRSAGSRIPIVMVSGSLAQTPLPAAVMSELFATLPKPARTAEVLAAVSRALSPNAPRQESLNRFRRFHCWDT